MEDDDDPIAKIKVNEHFIAEFQKHVCLWDTKHKLYRDTWARWNALEDMCKALALPKTDDSVRALKRKIQSLRTQFSRQLGKLNKSTGSGDAIDDDLETTWKWFKHFEFLRPHVTMKQGRPNLEPESDKEEIQSCHLPSWTATFQLDEQFLDSCHSDTQDTAAPMPPMIMASTTISTTSSPSFTTSSSITTSSASITTSSPFFTTSSSSITMSSPSFTKSAPSVTALSTSFTTLSPSLTTSTPCLASTSTTAPSGTTSTPTTSHTDSLSASSAASTSQLQHVEFEDEEDVAAEIPPKKRKTISLKTSEPKSPFKTPVLGTSISREILALIVEDQWWKEEHQRKKPKSKHHHFAMDLKMRLDEMPPQVAMLARREIEEVLFRYASLEN